MLAKAPAKKSFAFESFQFCGLKTQKCYILLKEEHISKTELSSLIDSFRDFLKPFHKASKCLKIPLLKPKVEIGSKKSNGKLFAYYYNDIIEHPNRQIRLSFRLGNNNSRVFATKLIELHGNQIILRKVVKLNHRQIHYLCNNPYYVANKSETNESDYHV